MVAWGALAGFAQAAVGLYGLTESQKASSEATEYARAVSAQQLRAVKSAKKFRKSYVMPILKQILSGTKPSVMPEFSQAFTTIDDDLQRQFRNISAAERNEMRTIADNVTGGAKIRLLRDLAMRTQDAKAAATRNAEARKSELDIAIANEWLSAGREYGLGTTATEQDYYNQQLQYATAAGQSAAADVAAMGQYLGEGLYKGLSGLEKKESPINIYLPERTSTTELLGAGASAGVR